MKEGGEEAPEGSQNQAAADEEQPLVKSEKAPTEAEEEERDIAREMCCCCVCHCQDEEDRPYSCCGCFPIKCGLVTIGILTLLVTFALFVEVFYCLLNEYIHWWYVPVALLMLAPLIVGAVFVIRFFTKDQQGSRTRMWIAMLLAIISFTLLAIWNLIYFQWLYKYDVVFAGADVVGYTMQTKKAFMVWSLFIGIVLDFTWAYFLCVATTYATCKDGEQEPIDWTGGTGDMVPKMEMGGDEAEKPAEAKDDKPAEAPAEGDAK